MSEHFCIGVTFRLLFTELGLPCHSSGDFKEQQLTWYFINGMWLLFTGSSGIIVRLSTNHFRLTSRPQWALYQYHIDYNPLMEARRLRSALLFQHEDLIGRCHAFDGTILFLPKRLQHKVMWIARMGRGRWGFLPQSKTALIYGSFCGKSSGLSSVMTYNTPEECVWHYCIILRSIWVT